jgi:hypothetical protein
MFRYALSIEHRAGDVSTWTEEFIGRLSPLTPAGTAKVLKGLSRRFPEAKSLDVSPIEDAEYRRRKAFANRHED